MNTPILAPLDPRLPQLLLGMTVLLQLTPDRLTRAVRLLHELQIEQRLERVATEAQA